MSRSKKLYILLGILVLACAVTFGVSQYEEHKELIQNSDEVILELDREKVTSLSWKNESGTLSFHKNGEDGAWVYDDDEAFPVDEEKINEMLGRFEAFGVSFIIEKVEDYGQYGLDDPVCTINIGLEESSYEILLGDYSAMDSERYVSIGDGNAYLVKNDPLDDYGATLREVIAHDKIPAFGTPDAVEFAGSENYQMAYEEESDSTYCSEDVYFTEQDGSKQPLDTARVNGYLQTLGYVNLTDYVSYNATEEELKAYGLEEPELTVTVHYTPEKDGGDAADPASGNGTSSQTEDKGGAGTFVLHIGRDPEERKAAEKKAAEEEGAEESATAEDGAGDGTEDGSGEEITAYARVGDSKIIYKITGDEYEALMDASYNSLRHQEVLSAAFEDIYQIDVSLEGADYRLTSEKEGDSHVYYYQEEKLEMEDFQSALEALKADGFTHEQPAQKEEISLTVYLDNENYPQVSIELYRYDGSRCLAVVDGKPVCFVKRANVVDLIESVNAIVLNEKKQ